MANSRWIRTDWIDKDTGKKVCGHAGRRGHIRPAKKEDGAKYVGLTYDDKEKHLADTVADLKMVLDNSALESWINR